MITLHPDEKLILTTRKHWFILAVEIFPLVIIAFAPLFLLIWADITGYGALFVFSYALWLLLLWIIAFVMWTNYYLDAILITDKRVIYIEQAGLFSRHLSEIAIRNIQDQRVEVFGILATMFNFGNLTIQSAGANRKFVMRHFPDPHRLRDIISQYHSIAIQHR